MSIDIGKNFASVAPTRIDRSMQLVSFIWAKRPLVSRSPAREIILMRDHPNTSVSALCEGLINLRSTVIPVVDLRAFGLPRTVSTPTADHGHASRVADHGSSSTESMRSCVRRKRSPAAPNRRRTGQIHHRIGQQQESP
jgi:hypothetical protein